MWKRGWSAVDGLWLELPFAAGGCLRQRLSVGSGAVDNAPRSGDT
jgi:hypothetical protein